MAQNSKAGLTPGRDHPITITKHPHRVTVIFGGEVIADTQNALSLKEASYPAVFYIPRADANMALLQRTARASRCPYKGEAKYFTINAGGRQAADAVWSYEHPYDAVAAIADHLAFYPDRVDAIKDHA